MITRWMDAGFEAWSFICKLLMNNSKVDGTSWASNERLMGLEAGVESNVPLMEAEVNFLLKSKEWQNSGLLPESTPIPSSE